MVHHEVNSKLSLLEERHSSLESRHIDMQQRFSDIVEKLTQRNEKLSHQVEAVRFENNQHADTALSCVHKMDEFENMVKSSQAEIQDVLALERRTREEQYRSMRETVAAEQDGKLSSLEGKMIARFERESSARDSTVMELIAKMHKGVQREMESTSRSPSRTIGVGTSTPVLLSSYNRQLNSSSVPRETTSPGPTTPVSAEHTSARTSPGPPTPFSAECVSARNSTPTQRSRLSSRLSSQMSPASPSMCRIASNTQLPTNVAHIAIGAGRTLLPSSVPHSLGQQNTYQLAGASNTVSWHPIKH